MQLQHGGAKRVRHAGEHLVEAAAKHQGMVYIRTTRTETPILYASNEDFVIGGSKVLRRSDKDVATVIAAGITLHEALKAYEELHKDGIPIRVIDLYSIVPIDRATLMDSARVTQGRILTVEDHYAEGGLGEADRDFTDDVGVLARDRQWEAAIE